MEVVTLLMIHRVKHVFQARDLKQNLNDFNMMTGINESKT